MQRRIPRIATTAFAVLLLSAAASEAAPSVSVDPSSSRAVFSDARDSTTDLVEVEAVRLTQSTFRYDFYVASGTISAIPPCTMGIDSRTASCIVSDGRGVTVDLGEGATTGAGQSVSLKGADWAAGQSSTLIGGSGPDVFHGAGGDDTLQGGDGADSFDGGPQGADHDVVSYASAAAPVRAEINGSPVSGIGCPQTCEGDTIATTVEGIVGGSANDVLIGSTAANRLAGGDGDDLLRGGLGADAIDGGAGTNTADYSQDGRGLSDSNPGIDVDLGTGTQSAHGSSTFEDTLVLGTIQNLIGTDGADLLRGDSAQNSIRAGGGNDTLKLVDGKADTAACGDGQDVLDADDIDVANADCDSVTRTATSGGGGGGGTPDPPASPAPPCADPASCGALAAGIFQQVFGCDSVESCQQKYPGGGGGGAPAPPCTDPATCGSLAAGVFGQVFGCDSVDSCQEKYPVGGDGGGSGGDGGGTGGDGGGSGGSGGDGGSGGGAPAPPCADPASCGSYFAGVFQQVFGCDSVDSCQEKYPAGGGGGAPAPPCADPASCGSYFAGIFQQVFGCDSVESCQQKFPSGGVPAPPSGPAPASEPAPAGGEPAPSSSGTTSGSSTSAQPQTTPKRGRPSVTLRVKQRRDRRAPYRFVAVGQIKRPAGVGAAGACSGRVRVLIMSGSRTVAKRTVNVNSRCGYRVAIVLRGRRGVPASGRMQIVARFLGNAKLQPRASRRHAIRAG